jgi:hypothetical protein
MDATKQHTLHRCSYLGLRATNQSNQDAFGPSDATHARKQSGEHGLELPPEATKRSRLPNTPQIYSRNPRSHDMFLLHPWTLSLCFLQLLSAALLVHPMR